MSDRVKNSRETAYGKGDNRRPYDKEKFDKEYERIFCRRKKSKQADKKGAK